MEALYKELDSYIDSLEDKQGSLIHVLHKAQGLFGYLPEKVQLHVARKIGVSGAKVFGVVSFYSYFETEPVGEHVISICMGTACFVRDAEKVVRKFEEVLGIDIGQTSDDMQFTLKDVRCIGACGLAPVVTIGEKVFGHVGVKDVEDIVNQYKKED